MEKQNKVVKWQTVVAVIGLVLFLYLALSIILVYGFDSRNTITEKTVHFLPFPAAIVQGKIIMIGNLINQLQSVRNFYENQDFSEVGFRVDFNTPDGKKRLKIKEKNILNKLIENKVIEAEANKRGINLTPVMVSQEVSRKLDEFGNQDDVEKTLDKLYGWTIADFEVNMVKPDLYMEKLFQEIKKTDNNYIEARKKITKAQDELKKGSDFESVVAQYSDGESAKNRGDVGWYGASEMLPEISPIAFNLEKGVASEIIESPLGYHIIRVEDKKTEEEIDKVKLKQIFVKTESLGDWLCEQEQNYDIRVFFKGYTWNKKECSVEFKDEKMKNFENNLYKNSADDISVMF